MKQLEHQRAVQVLDTHTWVTGPVSTASTNVCGCFRSTANRQCALRCRWYHNLGSHLALEMICTCLQAMIDERRRMYEEQKAREEAEVAAAAAEEVGGPGPCQTSRSRASCGAVLRSEQGLHNGSKCRDNRQACCPSGIPCP
jgi:hypothetical protein